MTVTLNALSELTLENAWRVGFEGVQPIISDTAKERIRECRAAFERLLESNEARFIYGSSAAPGARAKGRLSPEAQEEFAKSQKSRAPQRFGSGDRLRPDRIVLLILLARIAG